MGAKKLYANVSNIRTSILDNAYYHHINCILNELDEDKRARWETYDLIINDFIENGKDWLFEEIKYRITDGEDPNKVFLDIIERDTDNINSLSWFLKRRIEEYIEDDFFAKFL